MIKEKAEIFFLKRPFLEIILSIDSYTKKKHIYRAPKLPVRWTLALLFCTGKTEEEK